MASPMLQTLEDNVPLSRCMIWPLIERFYGNEGPEAFSQTPYYPTNNAFLADAYADLIVAFLSDTRASRDLSEPVYVIEWAAGMGVLAHLIRVALAERRSQLPWLAEEKLIYVLTDFTERNVEHWATDDVLKPGFAEGSLDRAIFRPEEEGMLHLRESGKTLTASPKNPVIVIANYFFDSIRHDYFRIEKGRLLECRVTTSRELEEPSDAAIPPRLDELRLKDRYVAVKPPYYGHSRFDALLSQYTRAESDLSFLFPIAGLRCLERLQGWTQGRFLFLCADKGFHQEAFMRGQVALPYTPHTGSFSYMVNFDALRRYFALLGGASWLSTENPPLTAFAASPLPPSQLGALASAARFVFNSAELPVVGYHVAQLLGPTAGADLAPCDRFRALLTCCRIARFDPWVFSRCGEDLATSYQESEYGFRAELGSVLERVEARLCRWAVGSLEAGRHVRRLWYTLGDFRRCLAINARLTAWHGEERDTHYYAAAIHERRGEWTAAIQAYERALRLDPACEHSRAGMLRTRVARGDKEGLTF
ncbi:MAG: hypothetical protein SFV32_09775 [Opitutaceae bacterium]|nr:hypothetical protein [Opitutaceae bacterium]